MIYTGYVRNVDRSGRICLPKGIMNLLNMTINDKIEILSFDDKFVIRKVIETYKMHKTIDTFGRINVGLKNKGKKYSIHLNDIKTEIILVEEIQIECLFCKKKEDLISFKEKHICKDCAKDFMALLS